MSVNHFPAGYRESESSKRNTGVSDQNVGVVAGPRYLVSNKRELKILGYQAQIVAGKADKRPRPGALALGPVR